ncbi:hypothetical protein T484DRAFT_1829215 [Baffinella frigidus]|nr:hypothetical protein T484DRAFT_1829215 [Cryptophyta sp. CCMP2293]
MFRVGIIQSTVLPSGTATPLFASRHPKHHLLIIQSTFPILIIQSTFPILIIQSTFPILIIQSTFPTPAARPRTCLPGPLRVPPRLLRLVTPPRSSPARHWSNRWSNLHW